MWGSKKHPLQNRTNVQIKGGGVKGLLNNVKKNCTFLKRWLPLPTEVSYLSQSWIRFWRIYVINTQYLLVKEISKVSAWFPQNIILKILPLQLARDQTSAKSPHSSATNLTSFDQSLFKRSCPHLFLQQMYFKWRNISFITSWNQKREFECMRLWGEVQGSRSMSFWDVQTFMFSSAQE